MTLVIGMTEEEHSDKKRGRRVCVVPFGYSVCCFS